MALEKEGMTSSAESRETTTVSRMTDRAMKVDFSTLRDKVKIRLQEGIDRALDVVCITHK